MSRHALHSHTVGGSEKKNVFKCFRNCLASLMSCSVGGRTFHARGPAYENARSPILLLHLGLRYVVLPAERSPGRGQQRLELCLLDNLCRTLSCVNCVHHSA